MMVSMNEAKTYVRTDEHGAMRIGQSRVLLESVIYAFQEGHSPETIRQQYPALSLEEIYGAIAFYLGNQESIHEYLQRQERLWEELRQKAEQNPSPVVDRLRSLRKASVREKE
jgi:uncharacterized protein (DUF433 family)